MAKIGLFYGSNEGNTAIAADLIKEEFDKYEQDVVEVHNIADASLSDIEAWDTLIFGISTWDIGQLQDDWAAFLPHMDDLNLNGKKLAVFGLGDQYGYPDTYIDAAGVIADKAMQRGAELYGFYPLSDYEITGSRAMYKDYLLGLGLDNDNEAEKHKARISKWVKLLAFAWGLSEAASEAA